MYSAYRHYYYYYYYYYYYGADYYGYSIRGSIKTCEHVLL